MCNEECLLSSNSNDAFLTVLAIDTSVVGTQQEVLLLLNVEAGSLELRGIVKASGELGNLSGSNVEVGGLGPDRIACPRVQSGLVKTSSDKVINVC